MAELVPEGQNLTIIGLDLPATGNYSCWAGPTLLDTTYVVVTGTRTEGQGWGSHGRWGAGGGGLRMRRFSCPACGFHQAGLWGQGRAPPEPHREGAPLIQGLIQPLTSHPLAASGEEEINVSCQAESYNGSFHCSWPGPPSAIFHARLTRRWVPWDPPNPNQHYSHPALRATDTSLPTVMAPWGRGCRWPVTVAGSTPVWQTPCSAPLERSCTRSSCTWRGSRTLPTSTSPGISSSVILVSAGQEQQGGDVQEVLEAPGEGLSPCSEPPLSTVRPDPPQELILQQRGEQLHLAWAPPASWLLPKSYFALLYHLQYELHNGTQVMRGGPAQRDSAKPTPCPHPAPSLTLLYLGRCSAMAPPHSAASLLGIMNCRPGLSLLLPPSAAGARGCWCPPPEGPPRPCPAPFAG